MLRIMTAFAVSLVLALWVIQNSTALQDTVSTKIIQFIEKDWSARISSCKPRINFFTFSLYLEKGTVTPTDAKQFSWSFDECHVHVSPLALLSKRAAHLYLTFNNIKATTQATSEKIDIIQHIKTIFQTTDLEIAVEPKALIINNIDFAMDYGQQKIVCKVPGTFYIANDHNLLQFKEETWHGYLDLEQALLTIQGAPYAHHAQGRLSFHRNNRDGTWLFSSNLATKLPALDPTADYTMTGTWDAQGGKLLLTDQQLSTQLAATFSYPLTIGMRGSFPVNHLKTAVTLMGSKQANLNPIGGTCAIDLVLLPDEQGIRSSGTFDVTGLTIGELTLPHVGINLCPQTTPITANTTTEQTAAYGLAGSLSWDWKEDQGTLNLTNTQPLQTTTGPDAKTHHAIAPNKCNVHLTCNTDGLCKGSYECSITNALYNTTLNHRGLLAFKNQKIAIKGRDDRGSYAIKAAFDPHPFLKSIHYANNDQVPIVSCKTSKTAPFVLRGSVSWHFLKRFLDQHTRRMIFGNQSSFHLALNQENPQALKADIALERGSFYMPEYHNLLRSCKASITVHRNEKRLEIDDCAIGMSKGSITCPHAVLQLDANNDIAHLMAPLCIENLFVNWKKDFYGFVCGTLALNKQPDAAALLSGTLVLKKSVLRDAFLRGESTSPSFYGPGGNLATQLPFPLALDIRLVTEKPIYAKTGSFNAQANVDLHMASPAQKDFFAAPVITGSIDLEKGALHILNQSLTIQYGKIQFLHNNFSDPLVDLVARNRIGKHLVTLQATGSLQHPTILLESTPALSEEQIIGLLLTGSEQSSLQADLPAMLLQNLDVLVFSNKKDGKGNALRDTLTKTFKYVQITPNLDANKTGRGALKGTISVNLTDQLRAKIDKDIDMQNNFSAQVEYLLSDNLNLKLVQELRGERGIELEFQVKV